MTKTVGSERVWEIVRAIYDMGDWRETKLGFQFWSDVTADLQALAAQIHTSAEPALIRPESIAPAAWDAMVDRLADKDREIERQKAALVDAWNETQTCQQEIERLQREVTDTKADYLRRHNDAVDRYEEVQRLQQLLKPHFCLCQERKTDPSAHGEQCPYRIVVEGGK